MPDDLSWKKRDLQVSRQRYFRAFEVRRNVKRARVIAIDGEVESTHKPGYAHVVILGIPEGGQTTARIGNQQLEDDMPVLIARDPTNPFEWQILKVYTDEIFPSAAIKIVRYQVGDHADNHTWSTEANKGSDAVPVYQPALQPLKLTGDGTTLTVTVQGCIYYSGSIRREFIGGTLDLTSNVPGSGLKREVLVYLDKTSNTLQTTNGTTVATGAPVAPFPTRPSNSRPAGWVNLTNGQTTVTTATHITDGRDALFSDTSYLADSLLVRPELTNYSLTHEAQTGVSGAVEIDHADGNTQKITVTGNITSMSFRGAPAAGEEGSLTLYVVQGGSGGYYIEWPDIVLWPSGAVPTASSGVNSLDVYVFKTIDVGVSYIGAQVGRDFSRPGATITIDAAIERTFSGSITADATIEAQQTGSVTADATIEAAQSGSVTADATIEAQQTGSVTADADIV
jgi:hypothetical protein